MTDRQLRKASRSDLLKLLLEEKKNNEVLQNQIQQLRLRLDSRQLHL